MAKVWAKHANYSAFGCTDEHKTLFRVPASEETTEQWIYWFIYCILLLPHRPQINMQFIFQLFTFTDITVCFCNSCVFNVNLCVNENLVFHTLFAIHRTPATTPPLSRDRQACLCDHSLGEYPLYSPHFYWCL